VSGSAAPAIGAAAFSPLNRRLKTSPARSSDFLYGTRCSLAACVIPVLYSLRDALVFFILRVLLQRQWLVAAAFVAIWVVVKTLGSAYVVVEAPIMVIVYSVTVVAALHSSLYRDSIPVGVRPYEER